jgi:hypothetical protein
VKQAVAPIGASKDFCPNSAVTQQNPRIAFIGDADCWSVRAHFLFEQTQMSGLDGEFQRPPFRAFESQGYFVIPLNLKERIAQVLIAVDTPVLNL